MPPPSHRRESAHREHGRRLLAAGALAAAVLMLTALDTPTPSARAPITPTVTARTTLSAAATTDVPAASNPLAGRPWGVYRGFAEQTWAPYAAATGATKDALAKIALAPKAKWFGAWIPNAQIAAKATDYITNAQAGDPEALVQMTLFRMVPWEGDACRRLPTHQEAAAYKEWMRNLAGAIGSTPTAIVLQADGPFALCAPHHSAKPSRLIAYAAQLLSALPRTSVYIDGGAADWPAPGAQGGVQAATDMLVADGIAYARGVALNSTHYSDTNLEVARGAAIVEALAARGIADKHVVVNTSSSGNPFEFGKYQGPDAENAKVCTSPTDRARTCVTLGIPPTTAVSDPRWGLSAETNRLAEAYVDGYLWFGRPWLYKQADPFKMGRAMKLVASSPY